MKLCSQPIKVIYGLPQGQRSKFKYFDFLPISIKIIKIISVKIIFSTQTSVFIVLVISYVERLFYIVSL